MGRRARAVDLDKPIGARRIRIEVQIYNREKQNYYPSLGHNMLITIVDQPEQQRMFKWLMGTMGDRPWNDEATMRKLGNE